MSKKRFLPTFALVAILLVAAGLRLWRLDALPPGLWYDEAVNGVDIRMILSGQGLPLYFPANGGREPLFIYLQALSVALFGSTPFSLRLVSALVGIATVAAVYACGGVLFRAPRGASPRVDPRWGAALAASVLAVTYWHLSLSRLGLRAVLLPLLSSLAMLFFWRAWTEGRRRDYAWAGLWFGLCLYTYTSARALPLVPALFVVTEIIGAWLRRRGQPALRERARGLALALLMALLVAAPLLVELARHPAMVLGRVGDVAASEDAGENRLLATATNAVTVVRTFYDRGDANVRHNLPGRPATDPLTALLFTAGLLLALLRIREGRARLLLLWFAVMLLPSILSGQAPHYLRAAGALPPFALLAGYGALGLAARLPDSVGAWVMPGLVALVLLFGGGVSARDYFVRWPASGGLAAAFTADEQDAAEAAGAALAADETVTLPDALYRAPNLIYRIGAARERIEAADALPPADDAAAGPVWQLSRSEEAVEAEPRGADGGAWRPGVPLGLQFANGLRLLGYDVAAPPVVAPGSAVTVTLYWEPTEGIDANTAPSSEVFAHLVADGAVRATDNGALLDNFRLAWPALHGLLVDARRFVIPDDAPPGKAWFEVGQYTRQPWEPYSRARRIPLVDANGVAAGDQVTIAPIMVAMPAPAADLSGLTPLDARFEERIALLGWRAARTGDAALTARFCWAAERRIPTDLTAFVHLIDASGEIVSQYDTQPGGQDNPTSRWAPGESACAEHPLTWPAGGRLDDYRVRVGLYEPVAGRQWQVSGADAAESATYLVLEPVDAP